MPSILLADADAFYVAVARMADPEGAGQAELLIVGGSAESRGVVCSASYETRRFGVRSAMSIAQALRLCPKAMCVPVPRKACAERSRAIRRVLQRFAPVVEAASIDEWYLDLAGTEALYGHEPLATTAARIRDAVRAETGLAVSLGGGSNKLVAKLAVELAKPKPGSDGTGVYVVPDGGEAAFVRRFALADIPLIGPRFRERLHRVGLRTVDHVLEQDLDALIRWFGDREGRWLHDRVRGIDRARVAPRDEAKQISREDTFPVDVADEATLERALRQLVARAGGDLRAAGRAARTVTVKLRDADFTTRQASRTLDEAVTADRPLAEIACALLRRLRAARRTHARLVGVALSSLVPSPEPAQLALFAGDAPPVETERDRAVSRVVDAVREKFGEKGLRYGP